MTKETINFVIKLLGFTGLLFAVHYSILIQFHKGDLHLPLWTIYVFNAVLVCIVYMIITSKSKVKSKNIFQVFLALTFLKMFLAIVFLLPLFFGKSNHAQLETMNFFIPYFLFLTFEILSLNKFLQKS